MYSLNSCAGPQIDYAHSQDEEATAPPWFPQRGCLQQGLRVPTTTSSRKREAIQDNINFVQVIANKFSWENGFLWTYNIPLRPTEILSQEDNRMRCLLQCLQYTSGEVMAKLPTETTQHISALLASMHPIVQQQFQTDFQYFGAKTTERLRGNSTIRSWISTNYDQHCADCVKSTGININNKKLINLNGK